MSKNVVKLYEESTDLKGRDVEVKNVPEGGIDFSGFGPVVVEVNDIFSVSTAFGVVVNDSKKMATIWDAINSQKPLYFTFKNTYGAITTTLVPTCGSSATHLYSVFILPEMSGGYKKVRLDISTTSVNLTLLADL